MYPAPALPMTNARSTPRLMIQGERNDAPCGAPVTAAAAMSEYDDAQARSGEVVLVGLVVPDHPLLVLERQCRHMARDRGLLPDRRGRDHLLVPQHRLNEVAEVVDCAVGLVEIGAAVQVDCL